MLTLSLILGGIYLIADEFKNPLASQSVGLFAAAFILATAMSLLVELTQLFRTTPPAHCRQSCAEPAVQSCCPFRRTKIRCVLECSTLLAVPPWLC